VPADTPIVIYELGDRADLKPGAKVFIVTVKQPDGTLEGRPILCKIPTRSEGWCCAIAADAARTRRRVMSREDL
jgi:hypothetical protein